ncbi:MAG: translation initiation factor IF-2 subunit beta [Candidatus Pacearchaeota archaeon]
MEYENLLERAYEKVEQSKSCERFELIKPLIKYEGKKTIIENFSQLASCIERKCEHLSRFLCKNLASYGEVIGERLILMRKIPQDLIIKKIDYYFEEYVKCKNCGKPDTQLIEENGNLFVRCLACGTKNKVNKF